ncbi:MAG: zf-HC2 domain-containing protein [bacterium]|nr:zf-HC2 domain-containing protein [bacterium]
MNGGRRDGEGFVRNVLARTSGSPCGRAETLLPDLTDGVLADLDRQLVQAHLEHCGPCRALAVAMGWASPVLPQLAVVDPGEAFTAAVLGRTSRRQRLELASPSARPGGLAGLMDRVGRWWTERILVPGFAPRVAYVATVVLVLLTSVPGAPLRGVPGAALQLMTAGPAALPGTAGASRWLDAQAAQGQAVVAGQWDGVAADLQARGARSAPAREQIAAHAAAAWRNLEDRRLSEAGMEGLGALDASRRAWTLWWNDKEQTTGE